MSMLCPVVSSHPTRRGPPSANESRPSRARPSPALVTRVGWSGRLRTGFAYPLLVGLPRATDVAPKLQRRGPRIDTSEKDERAREVPPGRPFADGIRRSTTGRQQRVMHLDGIAGEEVLTRRSSLLTQNDGRHATGRFARTAEGRIGSNWVSRRDERRTGAWRSGVHRNGVAPARHSVCPSPAPTRRRPQVRPARR